MIDVPAGPLPDEDESVHIAFRVRAGEQTKILLPPGVTAEDFTDWMNKKDGCKGIMIVEGR